MHAIRLGNILSTFNSIQNVPHTPTHRDGGTLDLAITKSEEPLDDVLVQSLNIISDLSLISWGKRLQHQQSVIEQQEI